LPRQSLCRPSPRAPANARSDESPGNRRKKRPGRPVSRPTLPAGVAATGPVLPTPCCTHTTSVVRLHRRRGNGTESRAPAARPSSRRGAGGMNGSPGQRAREQSRSSSPLRPASVPPERLSARAHPDGIAVRVRGRRSRRIHRRYARTLAGPGHGVRLLEGPDDPFPVSRLFLTTPPPWAESEDRGSHSAGSPRLRGAPRPDPPA